MEELLFLLHNHTRNSYNYRNKFNPLITQPDIEFRREYRMSKNSFRKFFHILSPLISGSDCDPDAELGPEVRGKRMPKYHKLLITLKYLATGNFHYDTGAITAYSPSQVCVVIREVATAIASLFQTYIKLPEADERQRVSDHYQVQIATTII